MSDVEELTPRLFDHAKAVYEEMLKRSHKEMVEHGYAEGETQPEVEVAIYEGHLTRLFADLQIPNPYYTKIMDVLKGQNCLEQLRRGGGVALSRWMLLEPPTEEGFKVLTERKRAPKGKTAILEQRVGDLMRMTSNLQSAFETLEEAYNDLYKRVQELTK